MVDDGSVADNDVLTVAQELSEVSRLVDSDDVAASLTRFVRRAVSTVPGCDHALITVMGEQGPEAIAEIGDVDIAESVQAWNSGNGPIGEALEFREPRRLEDVTDDQRWPQFSAAIGSAGFRSCLALPLPVERAPAAVFTLLSREPERFSDTSYDIVLLFTLHGGVVFDNAQLFHDSKSLVGQLTTALGTRRTIGQAEGILMHRYRCDTGGAFELLKGISQRSNTKLREVAKTIIAAHAQHKLDTALLTYGTPPPPP